MTQSDNILQELRELKSSLPIGVPQNIYAVPDGYFEGLAGLVLNKIHAMEAKNASEELSYLSPFLNGISRKMPFDVPAGYFENFNVETSELSPEKELETISPLLSGLNKKMPYQVPQGYFESIRMERPVAKVVSITHRKWFRVAAAAVVTGVIALAGLLYFNNQNVSKRSLARFEKSLNKELKKTSEKDLNEFVQQITDITPSKEDKVVISPAKEAKELLKDVPVTELKAFLDETSDLESTDPSLMD